MPSDILHNQDNKLEKTVLLFFLQITFVLFKYINDASETGKLVDSPKTREEGNIIIIIA